MIYKARDFEFDLSKRTYIIGIVNITPDSFSDGGEYFDRDRAVEHAKQLVSQGADILDLGAESSRPQAEPVSSEEEKKRLLPVIELLSKAVSIPLSIDTTKSDVARASLERGASIINDISGFKADPSMAEVVKKFNAGCILMHMRGTPRTMQNHTNYTDIVTEIICELDESCAIASHVHISRTAIMVDPGIGFAKTAEQNHEIIKRLKEFKRIGLPLLVGPSRKSFIGAILEKDDPSQCVLGTAAAVALAIAGGAQFIRVHDVAAMKDVACVVDAIISPHRDEE